MKQLYINKIHIHKVRHLENIDIPISDSKSGIKHLILTGKNGSGKTSLLEALRQYLSSVSTTNDPFEAQKNKKTDEDTLISYTKTRGMPQKDISDIKRRIQSYENRIKKSTAGLKLYFNCDPTTLRTAFENGEYVLAYYGAHRTFEAAQPDEIKKVKLKKYYDISDSPRDRFLYYMLDMKMTQAMAVTEGGEENKKKADEILRWFDKIEEILRDIYEDPSLKIEFDVDTYRFIIHENDREPFDFNTASDGFSAVLDIVLDLILRMQQNNKRIVSFTEPGIVLVDEIENHLHLALQKRILGFLTGLFPNIQFIVTTHSPFVVNSLDNAVIYDLENHTLVENGLTDVSFTGVVKGYFETNELSVELEEKFNKYKELVMKKEITDADLAEISRLEMYLDEMPDYLMPDIASDYQKLKIEFEKRENL